MEKPFKDFNPMWHKVDEEAVGVTFDCPACDRRPDGSVICMIHVQWAKPWRITQHLWEKSGDSFENLTLSPSIDGTAGGCKFHGWITDGIVRW